MARRPYQYDAVLIFLIEGQLCTDCIGHSTHEGEPFRVYMRSLIGIHLA